MTNFIQKQCIRWAEIGLSHQRIAMLALQEKITQITQCKDPFRAQLVAMQMTSEQLSNAIQCVRQLWSSNFEAHSQWNETLMHLVNAQQNVASEGLKFQWLAAQPSSEYANAMAESMMAMSRHFVNGVDASPRA